MHLEWIWHQIFNFKKQNHYSFKIIGIFQAYIFYLLAKIVNVPTMGDSITEGSVFELAKSKNK